ncbi:uncharacterized protein LOC110008798 [Jatropha curcas]|uniref:uncharacterized protein LOC110008798 n=1 Tax=Jatropha curcas TaxID=180498 RepID=UPI001893553B|nr:uncharacterized protein LOC110008798 [Jatropha curcas]
MHEKKESVNQDPAGKEDPYKRFLPLCRAIVKGDLNGVKGFLKSHPDAINKKIALGGLTALHLATISDKVKIVKELVNSMSVEDLQIQDDRNTTAFFIAVSNGCMRTVDLLLKKNNNLVTEPVVAELPVITACEKGFREWLEAERLIPTHPAVVCVEVVAQDAVPVDDEGLSLLLKAKQLGREPTPIEVFTYTHMKDHDQYVVNRRATDESEAKSRIDEVALYLEAVGGEKKRKVYGIGSQASQRKKDNNTDLMNGKRGDRGVDSWLG